MQRDARNYRGRQEGWSVRPKALTNPARFGIQSLYLTGLVVVSCYKVGYD